MFLFYFSYKLKLIATYFSIFIYSENKFKESINFSFDRFILDEIIYTLLLSKKNHS